MLMALVGAATRLNRSIRQVRNQGEKAAALQQAVDEALAPHVRSASAFSVTTIRAGTELVALHRAAL
jgi:hypothetical protein